MSLRTFFHDLAVRFVVLGWIFAQKPRKTPPKGHNFQPHPPAQARDPDDILIWSISLAAAAVWFALTVRPIRQAISTTA
ncbi:hypothetical protein Ccr10_gp345 [Caulobacter phage Ccr10]|nr:hypothetical protein Ccr10_gp345 [Caulobacter phage Ccr10]